MGARSGVRAELIAVGTELLWGDRVDTNTMVLSEVLADLGIASSVKSIVGDREDDLARVLTDAMARTGLILLTGGLGGTHDDMTTRVVAKVIGRRLTLRDEVLAQIKEAYRRLGRDAPPSCERQALLPAQSQMLPNTVGTAPGFRLTQGGVHVVALPGVPSEMRAMFDASVAPWLTAEYGTAAIARKTFHTFGVGELEVDHRLADLFGRPNYELGVLASPKGVDVRLRAVGEDRSTQALERAAQDIRRRLGDLVYAEDGGSMEATVGALLSARGWTLAVAESCTGGLVGHRLTEVPGSSRYFAGGWVTYANEAKIKWLGVDSKLLAAHGAVSEPVAAAMADGARRRAGAHLGLALTGIAGPDGGTSDKPVGLVAVGLASEKGTTTSRWRFTGRRSETKLAFSQYGLDRVRRLIAESRT